MCFSNSSFGYQCVCLFRLNSVNCGIKIWVCYVNILVSMFSDFVNDVNIDFFISLIRIFKFEWSVCCIRNNIYSFCIDFFIKYKEY